MLTFEINRRCRCIPGYSLKGCCRMAYSCRGFSQAGSPGLSGRATTTLVRFAKSVPTLVSPPLLHSPIPEPSEPQFQHRRNSEGVLKIAQQDPERPRFERAAVHGTVTSRA